MGTCEMHDRHSEAPKELVIAVTAMPIGFAADWHAQSLYRLMFRAPAPLKYSCMICQITQSIWDSLVSK